MYSTWISKGRRLKKVASGPGRIHLYIRRAYEDGVYVWEAICNTRMSARDVSKCNEVDCFKCIDAMETYDIVEKF